MAIDVQCVIHCYANGFLLSEQTHDMNSRKGTFLEVSVLRSFISKSYHEKNTILFQFCETVGALSDAVTAHPFRCSPRIFCKDLYDFSLCVFFIFLSFLVIFLVSL